MTIYAGETVRISTDLKDYDGQTVLTDSDVTGVTVEIFRQGTSVHGPVAMTWQPDDLEWAYDWDTSGADFGTYLAKCRAQGLDFDSWEFKSIRLNRNRA